MTTSESGSLPRRRDVAISLAVLVVMVLGTHAISDPGPGPSALGWALLVASSAAHSFRGRWPVGVMWAAIALGVAFTLLPSPGGFYTVSIAVGVYTVAANGRRAMALVGLAAGFSTLFLADVFFETGHGIAREAALWLLGWLTVAFLAGEVVRSRADYVQAVQERAVAAERSRHEETLRRAGEERMEIARELHDVLAHSISIINVQAGAALHHLDSQPERTREALIAVRETGKRALTELRSSIAVLRRDRGPAPTRPEPGIADIEDLAERTRLAGLDVAVTRVGDAEVPAAVGLAAYRIVQEALTNVVRHADAASASVEITQGPAEVRVRIEDDGKGISGPVAEGHGLDGMKERVRVLGGRVRSGNRPEGGFRVEATLPLEMAE